MTIGEIVGIVGVSLTVTGLAGRWLYNQGRKDRDSEAAREWKLEVIARLSGLSDSQERTVNQLDVLANTVNAMLDRLEGLEDRERERDRGPR